MGLRGPKPKKDILWSPEIAYGVGLMASDGCLSSTNHHLLFGSKDYEQVLNLKTCLGVSANIKDYSSDKGKYYRLQWGDITLYKFLNSIGLTSKKSFTIGALSIPDEFIFDFLRGSFDGDGTFYSYFDPRWKNSFMFYLEFISASSVHIDWIRQVLLGKLGVKGHITTSKGSTVLQLKYAKRETLLILEELYPNPEVLCLSRKRLKIEEALRIVGKSLLGET